MTDAQMSDGGGTDERFDAVVIGAGVIGAAVGLELTRAGLRTLNVDKLPAAGYGSTSSSSAVVRFNYSTTAGVALAWEGLHYWLDWPNHVGSGEPDAYAEFVNVPMLALRAEGESVDGLLERFDAAGVPYEDLDIETLSARWPALDFRTFRPPAPLDDHDAPFWGEPETMHAGAVVMPGTGYISDPQLAAQNLAAAAVAEGATFRYRAEVTAIDRSPGGERVTGVTFADGTRVVTPIVVNVAGPHSSVINAMAGVAEAMTMPTRPLRREVFVVPAPAGVDFEVDGAMIGDIDVGVYFRPERGNNVLIGSAEPECDILEWIEDPDVFNEGITEDEFQLLTLRTARRVRDLGVPHTRRGLASLYDATADWTPIYDRSDLDGFFMACGTSGNQFKNAAVAGRVMAELIVAVTDGHDHDNDPLVVTGSYTGAAIDLGTFTRNRVLTEDSATSVLG